MPHIWRRARLVFLFGVFVILLVGVATPATAHPFQVWTPIPGPYGFLYNAYPITPYYLGYYPPYGLGGYGYPDPGGYLKGAAEVINAQGKYLTNVQEAYLLREQVKSKEIANRRAALEQYLWERSNTPSLNEERERTRREETRRALVDPPATELWTGKSLNDILVALQDLRAKGYDGPEVAVPADTLRAVNVTPAKGPESAGLIKQIGRLTWPASLRTLPPENETRALQFQIDGLLAEARRQALLRGRVDATITRELEKNVASLTAILTRQVADLSFSNYGEAKRYLRQLDDAVKVLQLPDAGDYLNGKYAPHGKTVKDLVAYLSENGLRFSPAAPGEEAPYAALHKALVQYYQAAVKQLPSK